MSDIEWPVSVARGLKVAQRESGLSEAECDYRVVEATRVALPTSAGLEALTREGLLWRRSWVSPDRLVLDFIGVAVVEVRSPEGSIAFDRTLDPETEQHLLLDHVLPMILAWQGEIVVHGAVLGCGDKAAMLVGPSGAGKSTLTAFAGAKGWTIAGDDGAVLGLESQMTVEPTYPTVRLSPDALRLLDISSDDASSVAGKYRLPLAGAKSDRQQRRALSLVAILNAVPAGRAATFTRLRGVEAHAALFGGTIHADLRQAEMVSHVVGGLARVAAEVSVGRLAVPRGRAGLAAAERVLRQEMGGT